MPLDAQIVALIRNRLMGDYSYEKIKDIIAENHIENETIKALNEETWTCKKCRVKHIVGKPKWMKNNSEKRCEVPGCDVTYVDHHRIDYYNPNNLITMYLVLKFYN